MKLYFYTTGEGRDFESISHRYSAIKFFEEHGIEFVDHGGHIRIPTNAFVEVELEDMYEAQKFCEFWDCTISISVNRFELSFHDYSEYEDEDC
jgi:hypothetical protein